MDTRRKQVEEILESIYAIRHKLAAEMHFYFDKVYVTHSQWLVLHIAKKRKNISMKDLAKLLDITSSAATQIVDGLVNKELLVRKSNPDDRRALELELSEKAKEHFESLKNKSLKTMESFFDVLDNDELSKYLELNKKIIGKILSKSNTEKNIDI
jgi:MarR family transcriptional regulator, organic hydroperoxide resistance regulator